MLDKLGGVSSVIGIVLAAIGVVGYWKGSQAKIALSTYKESNDAYEGRIRQIREDVDALIKQNEALKKEVQILKELPLQAIRDNQVATIKMLDNIQATQTSLLKVLVAQNNQPPVHVEMNQK